MTLEYFILNITNFRHNVNSQASADENQLKCEKAVFFREWVKVTQGEFLSIFHFKNVLIKNESKK